MDQQLENICVDSDVRCVRCGYNLRTLEIHGRCPECGDGVAESVSEHEANIRSVTRWGNHCVRIVWTAALALLTTWVVYLAAPTDWLMIAHICSIVLAVFAVIPGLWLLAMMIRYRATQQALGVRASAFGITGFIVLLSALAIFAIGPI